MQDVPSILYENQLIGIHHNQPDNPCVRKHLNIRRKVVVDLLNILCKPFL